MHPFEVVEREVSITIERDGDDIDVDVIFEDKVFKGLREELGADRISQVTDKQSQPVVLTKAEEEQAYETLLDQLYQ